MSKLKSIISSFFLATAIGCSAKINKPEPCHMPKIENADIIFYPVEAITCKDTVKDIWGESTEENKIYAGKAYCSFGIVPEEHTITSKDGCCTVSREFLKLSPIITVKLPYRDICDAKWNGFIGKLVEHEQEHVKDCTLYTKVLEEVLETASTTVCSPEPSEACAKAFLLHHETENKIITDITAKLDKKNKAFDSTTDHGAKTGAILICP